MDRSTTRTDADAPGPRLDRFEAFLLPSRQPAWDLCLGALEAGPILVTGESGVGKTWLWRRLESHAAASWCWLGVDLTPANDPADLYRLMGHGLGLLASDSLGEARVDLADHLVERHVDGQRTALVVEEAHNLSAAVWEEVRVLANRLGREDGFAGLIVVGQSTLARRLSARPLAAVEARLAARVHLGPIDADEAFELLSRGRPDREWSPDEVDLLHRDSAGNPWRLLRLAGPARAETRPKKSIAEAISRSLPAAAPPNSTSTAEAPLLGPGRPPLRVEDHLIEVGWSPEDELEPIANVEEFDPSGDDSPIGVNRRPVGEEAVHDPYAALQAWREWTKNQAQQASEPPSRAPAQPRFRDDDEIDALEDDPSPVFGRPTYRTEGHQGFAPLGPLFTKLAQQLPSEPD